ncbi:MAG: BrnA antitoxin family protein [Nostoc sp.]|uniref:BrnA antitoxin family protein n=1 Tax=Nostoc sp. TaxID=1180 RepID=UPI002FF84AE2
MGKKFKQKGVSFFLTPLSEATLIQLDQDILDWFKSKGKGYQSLINSALCSYIEHNSSL